jgi:hypothetical protein
MWAAVVTGYVPGLRVVALLTEEQQATSQAQGVMWPVLREQRSYATHKERHPTAQIRLACVLASHAYRAG